jgi:hypothetical protein
MREMWMELDTGRHRDALAPSSNAILSPTPLFSDTFYISTVSKGFPKNNY